MSPLNFGMLFVSPRFETLSFIQPTSPENGSIDFVIKGVVADFEVNPFTNMYPMGLVI